MAAIECDKCGACCKTFPIFAGAEDIEREPKIKEFACRVAEWAARTNRVFQLHPLPFNDGCCFLKCDNLCSIYDTRPSVCRRFQAGSIQCNEARKRCGLSELGISS